MNMQVVNCPNCNGEVQIDSSREFGFCSFCGTKIIFSKDGPVNATQAFADNREAALAEIKRIDEHFEPIAEEFGNLDSINDDIQYYSNKSYLGSTFFLGVCIAAFIMGIVLIFAISESVDISDAGPGFAFSGISLVCFVLIFISRRRKMRNDYQTVIELKEEKKEISQRIISTYKAYPNCPIGIEYCRPEAIAAIYSYIRKGRAETIKEAVNLLANDEYNYQMKQIALNTLAIAEENLRINRLQNY